MLNELTESVLRLFAKANTGVIADVTFLEAEIINYFYRKYEKEMVITTLERMLLNGTLCCEVYFDKQYLEYTNSYSLTKQGVIEVRRLYGLEEQDNFKLNKIIDLIKEIQFSKMNEKTKEHYIKTLNEISDCFSVGCYNATIALCGKTIEIYLTEILRHFNIEIKRPYYDKKSMSTKFTSDLTLGQLFSITQDLPECQKTTYINSENIELIKKYRNGTVHFNEKIPVPSEDEAEGIISFTIDAIKRRLSYNW
jgi:hypothetical protein